MGAAHDVGSGENAHLWADELRRVIDLEDDTGRPLVLARTEGNYVVPAAASANGNGDGPRTDWIDYRASVARVHKREQNGDEPLTCPGCGTETDVSDVVHSPRCTHITAAVTQRPAAEWDEASVISALQAYAAEHDGFPPPVADWNRSAADHPTYGVVVRLFGSWADAVTAAGLEPLTRGQTRSGRRAATTPAASAPISDVDADDEVEPPDTSDSGTSNQVEKAEVPPAPKRRGRPPQYTTDSVIATIRAFHETHGRLPNWDDQRQHSSGIPSESVIRRLFGSWADAVEAAGFERPVRGRTQTQPVGEFTRERIIELLQAEAERVGESPTATLWREATPVHPTERYVRKVFGSWNAALEAAGLPARRRGVHPTKPQTGPSWAIKVPDTGLRYRTVEEALIAADEIEHDGERVARQARVDGDDGKSDQAIDASRELAEKIRAACNPNAETIQPGSEAPVAEAAERVEQDAESIPAAPEEREEPAPEPSRSSDAEIVVAAVRELDPLSLTGEQTAGWIARLEAESERLHRRAQAFDKIAEGLRLLGETDV